MDSRRGLNGIPDGFEGPWPRQGDWGAARRAIFCRNDRQNTARIDRTAHNGAFCRAFLRSVLSIAYRPRKNVPFCRSFFLDLTVAVDAGDTITDS